MALISDEELERLTTRLLRLNRLPSSLPLADGCDHRLASWPCVVFQLDLTCLDCLGFQRTAFTPETAALSLEEFGRRAAETVGGAYAGEIDPSRSWRVSPLGSISPVSTDASAPDAERQPRAWSYGWDCHYTVVDHPHLPDEHRKPS